MAASEIVRIKVVKKKPKQLQILALACLLLHVGVWLCVYVCSAQFGYFRAENVSTTFLNGKHTCICVCVYIYIHTVICDKNETVLNTYIFRNLKALTIYLQIRCGWADKKELLCK